LFLRRRHRISTVRSISSAADERIDAAFLRQLVQVGGELLERRGAFRVAL
jgi:hypothetical protein